MILARELVALRALAERARDVQEMVAAIECTS
jgi:hypothetical protein